MSLKRRMRERTAKTLGSILQESMLTVFSLRTFEEHFSTLLKSPERMIYLALCLNGRNGAYFHSAYFVLHLYGSKFPYSPYEFNFTTRILEINFNCNNLLTTYVTKTYIYTLTEQQTVKKYEVERFQDVQNMFLLVVFSLCSCTYSP